MRESQFNQLVFFLSPPSYIPSITAISVISNSSLELSLTGTPITGIISVKIIIVLV